MSEIKTPQTSIKEDEITLKELILKIKEFYFEVLLYWKLAVLIILPFTIYFLFKALTTPTTYSAELTFMLNEDEGGSGNSALAILSQFGFGGGQSTINLEKLIELSKSRKIIHKVLFERIVINSHEDFIANHLIKVYDYHKRWKDSSLEGFNFEHDSIVIFDQKQNRALKALYSRFLGNSKIPGLLSSNIDDDTGILTLRIKSESEQLSLEIVKAVFNHLSQYYVDKSIEKQKATYDIVKIKSDSLKISLASKESALAKYKDSNRAIWSKSAVLKEQQLLRDIQVLNLMYAESLKNLEIADFSLKSKTPFIQVIDLPFSPISPQKSSYLISLITGTLMGSFIAIGFIVGRKIIRDELDK